MVLLYTKKEYQLKVTELEGLHAQLATHLDRMEAMKGQMYQFWDDPQARQTGELLAIEIRQVRNAMDRTSDLLNFYKGAVQDLDETQGIVSGLIEQAIGILSGTGI